MAGAESVRTRENFDAGDGGDFGLPESAPRQLPAKIQLVEDLL